MLGCTLLLAACPAPPPEPPSAPFEVEGQTIPELQQALTEGRVTSRELVEQYLVRIALYNGGLNAVMHVNRNALAEADRLDAERRAGLIRGPLHGIPVALKDNINTNDMPTTGGALAFEGYVPPYDATVTARLREAGAIILAKTVMTELAHWVSGGMPANYSALGGYALNPHDPRRDPREGYSDGRALLTTGGSSSGVGTAMSFWAANIGTETSGSILSPAGATGLVGLKPTVGRVSRHGIMPITTDQDTAGPMTRSVVDAAILLSVLEGPDAHDDATGVCAPLPEDFLATLRTATLEGVRIGVPRHPRFQANPAETAVLADAIERLRELGAVVVDVEIPSMAEFVDWPVCAGEAGSRGRDTQCSMVFKYGMQRDFNAYLDSLGETAPVQTLAELVVFNRDNAHRNAIRYGQVQLEISADVDLELDRERYEQDRARDLELSRDRGIDAVMNEHDLDTLLFAGTRGANMAARAGYPSLIIPFGTVPNPTPGLPAELEPREMPFGVTFTGMACSELQLLQYGNAMN